MRKQTPINFTQKTTRIPRWNPRMPIIVPPDEEPHEEQPQPSPKNYRRLIIGLACGMGGLFLSGLCLLFAYRFEQPYAGALIGLGFGGLYKFGSLFGYFHHKLFD